MAKTIYPYDSIILDALRVMYPLAHDGKSYLRLRILRRSVHERVRERLSVVPWSVVD